MKLITTHIILAILALTALSSCTHNDGDIGPWFGLWHLDSIEIDGVPDAAYDGHIYFMFQNKVFSMRWVDDSTHSYIESFAQWQHSDDDKTLTISFIDNRYSPRLHEPAPDIYLTTTTTFSIVTLNDQTITLSQSHPVTNQTITYHLTTWR